MLFDVIIRKDAQTIAISTAQRRDGEGVQQFCQRAVDAARDQHRLRSGGTATERDVQDVAQIGGCLKSFIEDVYGSGTASAECTAAVTADHRVGTYEGDIQTYLDDAAAIPPVMMARFYARPPVAEVEPRGERVLEAV